MKFFLKKAGLFALLLIILSPYSVLSMTPVSDETLEDVIAGEGLSILLSNIQTTFDVSPIALHDTDGTSTYAFDAYFFVPAFSGNFKINRLDDMPVDMSRIGDYTDANDYAYYDYSTMTPRPLTLDIYSDDSVHDWLPSGGGIVIGVPTAQLAITEWSDFHLMANDYTSTATVNTPGVRFATFKMNNNFLEFFGGNIGISPKSGEGFYIYFNDVEAFWNTETIDIIATSGSGGGDTDSLQLHNFLLHGEVHPAGHPNEWGPYMVENGSYMSLNMETTGGRTYFQLAFPSWTDRLFITLGQMKFQDIDFGFWDLRDIKLYDNSYLRLAGRNGGGAGIDFEITSSWKVDQLRYDYGGSYASFDKIYLCNSVVPQSMFVNNTEHDPASGWNNTGFATIGDFGNSTPVQLNAGSNSANTLHELEIFTAGIDYNNPSICGSLAVENLRFGGYTPSGGSAVDMKEFGPIIAEGIKVHYLKMTFRENWAPP